MVLLSLIFAGIASAMTQVDLSLIEGYRMYVVAKPEPLAKMQVLAFAPPAQKRDIGGDQVLATRYNFYQASFTMGSPQQRVSVLVDTGSPESWVYDSRDPDDNGRAAFDSGASKTFEDFNQTFSISYGGASYKGDWVGDSITLGKESSELHLREFAFGLVGDPSCPFPGILGLGPSVQHDSDSSTNTKPQSIRSSPKQYSSLIREFKKANLTTTSKFALSLTDTGAKLIIDGYESHKLNGSLHKFNVAPQYDAYANYYSVPITSASYPDGSTENIRQSAILDISSPLTLMPAHYVHGIADYLGLTLDRVSGIYYTTRKSSAISSGNIDLQIGGLSLSIPLNELFIDGRSAWGDKGPSNATAFSIVPSSINILGQVIFRHAYSIFDPEDSSVYLANLATSEPKASAIAAARINTLLVDNVVVESDDVTKHIEVPAWNKGFRRTQYLRPVRNLV